MKKNILKEASVLLIGVIMICSSLAAIATTDIQPYKAEINNCSIEKTIKIVKPSFFQAKCVVWDNKATNLTTAYHAQDDPSTVPTEWDSFPADDFQFTEDTDVYWVYWAMCYWNCNPVGGPRDFHYDWNITFFEDDGTGNGPGVIFAGPFTITDADIIKGEEYYNSTTQANGMWISGMGALLPNPITFTTGTKYWISLYSTGPHFPQSGWYCHNESADGILLHEAVFKSAHWGYPDWTDFTIVHGEPLDMAFLLGGELLPFEVTLSKGLGIKATIKNLLPEPYYQENITVTFTATGGFVFNPIKTSYIEKLDVGATDTLKYYPIGFGKITVEVYAISNTSAAGWSNTSGSLFLIFVA